MPESALQVGASRVDITPPLHVPYLGFEPRQGTFEGVHDPLFARAAAFSTPEASIAVLSGDSLGFSRDLLGPERHQPHDRGRVPCDDRRGLGAGDALGQDIHLDPSLAEQRDPGSEQGLRIGDDDPPVQLVRHPRLRFEPVWRHVQIP